MKKYIVLLYFAIASCGLDYDAETRLISEIQVVNSDGMPIVNSRVSIRVHDNSNSETVSSSLSNGEGKTLLIFPAPEDYDALMTLDISEESEYQQQNYYLYRSIGHIRKSDFIDYKLPISQIVLYRQDEVVNLSLQPNTMSNNFIRNLEIVGELSGSTNFDNVVNSDFQTTFQVVKNQEITINYTMYNASLDQYEDHSENILIGNEDLIYTLNF